jgi:hypothetical protein
MTFGKNKLTNTLAKVSAFIKELEDGIEVNETKVEVLNKEIQEKVDQQHYINQETGIALRLLDKLQ